MTPAPDPFLAPAITYAQQVDGRPVVVSSNRAAPATLCIRYDGREIGGIPMTAARAIAEGIDLVGAEIAAKQQGGGR